jgi:hypothetical protein
MCHRGVWRRAFTRITGLWVSPPMLQEQMFGSKIVRTIVAGNAMGEMPQQKEMARFKVREPQRIPLHRTHAYRSHPMHIADAVHCAVSPQVPGMHVQANKTADMEKEAEYAALREIDSALAQIASKYAVVMPRACMAPPVSSQTRWSRSQVSRSGVIWLRESTVRCRAGGVPCAGTLAGGRPGPSVPFAFSILIHAMRCAC